MSLTRRLRRFSERLVQGPAKHPGKPVWRNVPFLRELCPILISRAERWLVSLVAVLVPNFALGQVVGGPGAAKPQHPASTESPAGLQLAGTAVLASDYVNRGVSQTSGAPEISGGLEARLGGFYAGVTAFHVNFRHMDNRATNAEIDIYTGYATTLAGQGFDVGVIRYDYTPQPKAAQALNYTEIYAKTARKFGPVTLAGSIYYSPKGMSASGTNWYSVVSSTWAVSTMWKISGLFGRQAVQAGGSYNDWNLGASYALTKSLELDLRYWDTNRHRLGPDYGGRAVASLNASF